MAILIWICISIDVVVALFLLGMLANPDQDAAGEAMLLLPVVLLLVCAGGAWLLMSRNHRIAALVTSAVPAIVAVYLLFLTIKKS
ncbi:MAG: hypothetical protein INR73_00520 [Williamsia sp.]|nr:hypothetical protein [Williamsia sp.]